MSYHSAEVPTGLLVQTFRLEFGCILALLLQRFNLLFLRGHFGIDLDVEFEEVVDRILLQLIFTTIALEGQGQEAILLAPITKV